MGMGVYDLDKYDPAVELVAEQMKEHFGVTLNDAEREAVKDAIYEITRAAKKRELESISRTGRPNG